MADLFGTGPQTTTTDSNYGFATPYFDRLFYAAEGMAQQPLTTYGGQRIAQSSPLQTMAFQQASGSTTPQTFQQAADLFATTAEAGKGLAGFAPGKFDVGTGFTAPAAQQYMNPYTQNVLDIQRREADRDFQKQQNQLRMGQAQRGAFGGSRATLLESEAQRNQNQLMDDIQQKGLQAAYEQGRNQFNTERNFGLDAFKTNEAARQQAADLLLKGNQQAQQAATGLAGLGSQSTASEINRINQLADLGNQMRGIQQQGLDVDYKDFLEQRDYGKNQLNFLSNILSQGRGASSQTQTAPGANLLGQIANLGIGGLSLFKLLEGLEGKSTGNTQ